MPSCNPAAVPYNRNFIPLFHVRRSGYDLDGFFSDIDLTDNQFICIRMAFYLCNLANHNLFQIFIKALIALYFCSA